MKKMKEDLAWGTLINLLITADKKKSETKALLKAFKALTLELQKEEELRSKNRWKKKIKALRAGLEEIRKEFLLQKLKQNFNKNLKSLKKRKKNNKFWKAHKKIFLAA